jgi:hypothetical protein
VESVETRTNKANLYASIFCVKRRKKIGKLAAIKKKCRLVVLATDSKFAIGRKSKDKENIALLDRFWMCSEEARYTVKVIQDRTKVLNRKIL